MTEISKFGEDDAVRQSFLCTDQYFIHATKDHIYSFDINSLERKELFKIILKNETYQDIFVKKLI